MLKSVEHLLPKPKPDVTGFFCTPCLIFGNGVEIETVVDGINPKNSSQSDRLKICIGSNNTWNIKGTDVVQIHFLPTTPLTSRTNDPTHILESEKNQIRIDCLIGFLSLARAITQNEVTITRHKSGDDFYLYADTNQGFALFLIQNCGFKGSARSGKVWIIASQFVAKKNIQRMMDALRRYKNST